MSKSRNRKAKKKKRRARSMARRNVKEALRFLPMVAPLIITAFIFMWQNTRTNIDSMPVEQLQAKKRKLTKQNDTIRLRIEVLQAPKRIESIAREKLGMISPQQYRLIALEEPIRSPGPAARGNPGIERNAQAGKKSEGLFDLLTFGFLKERGESKSAAERTASAGTGGKSG